MRVAGRLAFATSVVAAVAVVGLPAAAEDETAGVPSASTTPAATSPAPSAPSPTSVGSAVPTVSATPDTVIPPLPTSAVTAGPLPTSAVTAGPLPTSAVTADPLPTSAVTAGPLPTSAVTAGPLPTSAVTADPVPDGLPTPEPGAAAAAAARVGVLAQPAECPTSAAATFEVAGSAVIGGTLRLQGTGWCHPTDGGSVIAVKINDGAYSHLTGQGPNANLTVWQVVEAGADGSFDVGIRLPTASNSTPEFTPGTYTLRLLTGSLKAGDNIRAVQTDSFTVTAPASPGGSPTPSGSPNPGSGGTDDELPTTGIDAYRAGLLGGLFILAGSVALACTRRPRPISREAAA
ncbi:hypothetical protein O7632_00460 [Solwaraspora sp. WMMD406]|uniref:hypothetical protein n=1 Tax=Solwaraspora sp. WMMD406 TaxID=3016095 RepID=UPI002416AD60|nr:hypothetical protein [Solwaraspora sp. WMMD406]MDG4762594.1 hypothetical protein [Solwaraspora sp. WMMD406]